MANTYRASLLGQVFNTVVTGLIRLGVPMGPMALLTVPGRKSGQPRTTPIAILDHEGQSFVLTPYGAVNWVRNLRAAGGGTITRRGRSEQIAAVELDPKDAAPVLKAALQRAPKFLLSYFDVPPSASLEEFEREAQHHPVFRLDPAASPVISSRQNANRI
jgi:deazaflavin-dependent oxidoreductase (nitroreductase family)